MTLTAPALEDEELRYIVFRVGSESFAAPLLSIKEIVDPLPYCYVPNEHDYFLGLANLRGQIVGVIDLGLRFAMPSSLASDKGVLLICEQEGETLAALVSRVECSLTLEPSDIIAEVAKPGLIPSSCYLGVLRHQGRVIPIVSIARLLHDSGESLEMAA